MKHGHSRGKKKWLYSDCQTFCGVKLMACLLYGSQFKGSLRWWEVCGRRERSLQTGTHGHRTQSPSACRSERENQHAAAAEVQHGDYWGVTVCTNKHKAYSYHLVQLCNIGLKGKKTWIKAKIFNSPPSIKLDKSLETLVSVFNAGGTYIYNNNKITGLYWSSGLMSVT